MTKAKHAGNCPLCTLPFEEGDRIALHEDGWGHLYCPSLEHSDDVPGDGYAPGPGTSGPAVVVSGFKIGTHIFIGEQESLLNAGEYRWSCSCGGKGNYGPEGYGWYRWLSHVMSKYHTVNWPLYHEARLLQGDQ